MGNDESFSSPQQETKMFLNTLSRRKTFLKLVLTGKLTPLSPMHKINTKWMGWSLCSRCEFLHALTKFPAKKILLTSYKILTL